MANRAKVACMAGRTISARSVAGLLPEPEPGVPAYQSLAEGLRRLVADGRILRGTRLPSERELTAVLGVSRTTVSSAYALLRERGYLHSRRGSGSVAAIPGLGGPGGAPGGPLGGPLGAPGLGGGLLAPGGAGEGVLDLTCAAPGAAPGTAAAYEDAVAELPRYLTGTGYDPNGLPQLRAAIADRFTARGLATGPDQVMVTTGTLSALAVVARAFLGPGDRMLMESPTYPNAIATARRSGVRPVGLPMESDGWDPEAVDVALRQSAARAAYLIPDFHNPTGFLMPADVREAVGAALRRSRTLAIVDETVAELALDDVDPVPPLAAYDPGAITIGGVSKLLWGGLRLGWVRAPLDAVELLTDARLTLDLGAPVLEQLVLIRLLASLETIRPARREALREGRAAMVSAVRELLPQWRFRVPAGGLSLWCELPAPRGSAVVAAAEQEGLLLATGGQFGVDGGLESFLRLPYTLPVPDLRDAVQRLARAWERAADAPARAPRRSPLVA
jgi:DNA-binding transcriptional MocR family regulator